MNDGIDHAPGAPEGERQLLLAQVESAAAVRAQAEAGGDLPPRFARLYLEQASLDTLRRRSSEELAEVALGHLRFGHQRLREQRLVRVRPPRDVLAQGSAALASVETCVDDAPYLVDTVGLAVREVAFALDWAVHPVLRLRRSAEGGIVDVAGPSAAEGSAESWIHLEFEALAADADYAALQQRIQTALADLALVQADTEAMRRRALEAAEALPMSGPTLDAAELGEARALLQWLADERFIFLGCSEARREVDAQGGAGFVELPERGLGLARAGRCYADTDAVIAPQEELNRYAVSSRIVVVTKANQRSHIHAAEYLDVVSVKRVDAQGQVIGTSRFLGLFSSDVYIDRPLTIPLVRRKVEYVLERARFPASSFSGRALREIMHLLPREELFQSSEQELYDTCMGIRALGDRQQLKLFMRRDRYGRFFSCMIYLPRERYTRELLDRVAAELSALFDGSPVDRSVEFLRGGQARIRCLVRTPPGTTTPLSTADVEKRLIEATRSWREQLRDVLLRSPGASGAAALTRFSDAFPLAYTENTTPLEAAADLQFLLRLSPSQPLLPRLIIEDSAHPQRARLLKLYSLGQPVLLSDVLPTLENFGLRVLAQEPVEVRPRDGAPLWIERFHIEAPTSPLDAGSQRSYFESALLAAWTGDIENDGLNRLVLAAGLSGRQVTCLRALAKYLNQVGLPYGRADIEKLLADHAGFAQALAALFEARFDPALSEPRRQQAQRQHQATLDAELDGVASLDADRVLRCFVSVVRAALRTNFYQNRADGTAKPWVSIKLDPAHIPELPAPRPMFEIWVYAPEVEGVHLRGGRVARGGLRWSDRREDFRTEVLGLMKAQMVKNAVIVPVGAKGGFVVKKAVDPAQREAWMQQGIACYKTFLRGLLDITDNQLGDRVLPPTDVVRHDGDDPYLVVAADKGTASFSDIANGISAEYGFWLGDAFASGGSRGYDHKKMGITARGAWESVKRHFREMQPGRDIQAGPFTVVGIGDMSGDVFGNGMLLSRQIRLLAAFDHRHIFLDPQPDPATSFVERERLFALPRSSWADYDTALISAGGGVYARSLKSIALTPEVRAVLGVAAEALTPGQLISAILRAPVDLLWNGGIGTYVKSSQQGHEQVGDRANDAIRVNGRELRCQVVGEGGNLGFTQLGRIEYALHGGRINSDAIDNCAGVHTSDCEVNIKIPLNRLMAEGSLTQEERDPLLERCTDEIAALVLHENYVQPACISLEQMEAAARLDEHAQLMRSLERDGLLIRALEFLPDEETLKERRGEGLGLTRPELGVLVAYAKIALFGAALSSAMPDDPFFTRDLLAAFPRALVERYGAALEQHRLRREIIATVLANAIVDRMGVSFAQALAEDHGTQPAEVLEAYAVAHEVFGGDRYWRAIEALDHQVPAALQYRLMQRPIGLLKHATSSLIGAKATQSLRIGELVARYRPVAEELERLLPALLPAAYREDWNRAQSELEQESVPTDLAQSLAATRVLGSTLDIAALVRETGVSVETAAQVYYACGERFRLVWIHGAIRALKVQGPWERLARNNLRDDTWRIHYLLALAVLRRAGTSAGERLEAWMAANDRRVRFALNRVQALQSSGAADFMGLVVAVRELRKLRAFE